MRRVVRFGWSSSSAAARRVSTAALAAVLLASSTPAQPDRVLARFAGRGTRIFLEVRDGPGFVRRLARSDAARAWSAASRILGRTPRIPLPPWIVPPIVERLAPKLLLRFEGDFALAVEGAVLEEGSARPDLLLACRSEDLVALHARMADIVRAGLPIRRLGELRALGLEPTEAPAELTRRGGCEIVRFELEQGGALCVTALEGVLLGARDERTLAAAIERVRGGPRGSLEDEPWYRQAAGALDGRRGTLRGFANLRLLRSDEPFLERFDPLLSRAVSALDEAEAIGFSLRGEGDVLRLRAYAATWSAPVGLGPPGPVGRGFFEMPGVAAAAGVSGDGIAIARALVRLHPWLGGIRREEFLRRRWLDVFGGEAAGRLAEAVGGVACFRLVHTAGAAMPAVVASFTLADPEGARQALEQAVRRGRGLDRRLGPGGRAFYSLDLGLDYLLSTPVGALEDGRLVVASNAAALRKALEATGRRPDADRLLEPWDRLDRSPADPLLFAVQIDPQRLAPLVALWATTVPMGDGGSEGMRSSLWDGMALAADPEVIDRLHGLLVVGEPAPGGILVEAVGP